MMNQWLNVLVAWLESTGVHQTMQTVEWAVPTVQTIHILAIAAVFASSLVLSMSTLQLVGPDWSPARWGSRLNGWIVGGLLVLLLTGILMICGEPGRSLNNFLFQTKMLLLILAVGLFVLLARTLARLNRADQHISAAARLLALALMAVWVAIIVCGRWIAYT